MSCTSGNCGYGKANGRLGCNSTGYDCRSAKFADANESTFHPVELEDATRQIMSVLEGIEADPEGRNLAFLDTPFGNFLAWVVPDYEFGAAVTSLSSEASIASALGLNPTPSHPAPGNAYSDSSGCTGGSCGYGLASGKLGCGPGGNDCRSVRFAEASTTSFDFHPTELEVATQQIINILQAIPSDPAGRKLAFLATPNGNLLAWVEEGLKFEEAVTSLSSHVAIVEALKLKEVGSVATQA